MKGIIHKTKSISGDRLYDYAKILQSLIGFDAGNNTITDWASLKPYVTAKAIKIIINPDSEGTLAKNSKVLTGPMFRGPRLVKLIPTPIKKTIWLKTFHFQEGKRK
jgi:hypothetical protein